MRDAAEKSSLSNVYVGQRGLTTFNNHREASAGHSRTPFDTVDWSSSLLTYYICIFLLHRTPISGSEKLTPFLRVIFIFNPTL